MSIEAPACTGLPGHLDTAAAIPPLEPGDQLERREFQRRYRAMPALKKAEQIDRVVFLPPPLWLQEHGEPPVTVLAWRRYDRAATSGVGGADITTLGGVDGQVLEALHPGWGGAEQARFQAELAARRAGCEST